ncbi:uncharacterized protein LOC143901895 isoform X1 [Temnothorax americanus]|uniref:uncharacterized protein LOC143901895 isoform X1 n=1 Tax=Temnothorax americanus TaxID=1964332 RepID=UPI00406945E5
MHLRARGEMICIDSLHISLNRFLLLTVGLWPYQRSKLVQLQFALLFSVLATFILAQFATFLTSQCTPDLLINVFASALFYINLAIKYSIFSNNVEVIKCLLEQLQHNCNELTDENEINIIKQYAIYAKRYTIALTLVGIFIIIILILYPIWSRVFYTLLSINETHAHISPLLVTEYFVDKRYFYLIFFHTNAAFFIGLIAMLATGTMFIVYSLHACGMFQITCYRIARTMTLETLRKNSLQNEYLIYKRLICAVDMHRKAMKFSNSTLYRFKIMFTFMIITGVMCGSLNIFLIFQITSFKCDIEKLLLRLIIIMYLLTYMFVSNYFAQKIMDHNDNVFVTVYNVQWYVAPLLIQKMILFLLQRRTKAFTMNIAGLFVGSLEVVEYWNIVFYRSSFCAELTKKQIN